MARVLYADFLSVFLLNNFSSNNFSSIRQETQRMWADLLSMIAVGAFAACMVFIVRRSLNKRGRRLPRWIMPAAIGATMITYSIWNEYTWFDRITAGLPDSVEVVGQGQRTAFWAPWTFISPVTVRFIALDTHARARSDQRPDLVLTELLLVERWQPTRKVAVAFDCATGRRADLGKGASVRPDGTLLGSHWESMNADDPMLRAACRPEQPA
jgi:hypothetical protein